MLAALQAVCKLGLVITSVLANLMADGFCSVNEEGECEGDGDGDGNFQGAEGTGLGEGEGTRDVSDQIENQDQVLGAKQEQDQEKEEDAGKPIDKDGKTTGIEMDDDFDGEMNELSDDEEAANSSGEDNDGAVDNLDEEVRHSSFTTTMQQPRFLWRAGLCFS